MLWWIELYIFVVFVFPSVLAALTGVLYLELRFLLKNRHRR